jgi:hypothetical protein
MDVSLLDFGPGVGPGGGVMVSGVASLIILRQADI